MLSLKLAWRFFIPKSRLFTFVLAITCLCIGVGCLVATLAVVSGFESSLRRSVIDVTGDVFVTTRRASMESDVMMWDRLKPQVDKISSNSDAISFVLSQGIVAHNKKISGVVVQGLQAGDRVVNLEQRLIKGTIDISSKEGQAVSALVGRGFARKMDIDVGDQIRVVFPIQDDMNVQNFRRKIGAFKVRGIVDLGKYDYDERYILTDLTTVQDLLGIGAGYSGLLIDLPDASLAASVSQMINREFSASYRSRDWFKANRNLFQAIVIEKRVIFLVVSIIVIVAAFNISSTLFINVVQKFREIAVLKSLGLSPRRVLNLFLWQGFLIGLIGVVGGVFFGYALTETFQYVLQNHLQIPGDVYKLNQLDLEIRMEDLIQISGFTMLICLLSTIAPALRGSRIQITEGLRYE